VGRDRLARIKAEGVASKLVGLAVEDGVPRHGYAVLHDGGRVGTVASGTFSPTLGGGIATAYVPAALSAPGTRLAVEVRRKTVGASVVRTPFVTGTSLTR
jgi:aminomethyltransferase